MHDRLVRAQLSVAQSGMDPMSLHGGFGHSSVKELGLRGGWGEMLPFGYNMCSAACMGMAEDPMGRVARDAV